MARTEASLTIFAFTQYLDPDYWSWADKSLLATRSAGVIMGEVVAKLEAAGAVVDVAYAIVHDKDEREVWDEFSRSEVVVPKPDHIHGAVRFQKGKGLTLAQVAAAVGVEPQYIEKPKSGPFTWDNVLSYLVHAKHPDKHQYDPAEVVTVKGGPPYSEVFRDRYREWSTKGRAAVAKAAAKLEVDDVVARVLRGEITREQIMLTDELFNVMAHHQRAIEDALQLYGQRRAMRAAAKLSRGDFATTVIFVTGHSGSGKTRWAMGCIQAAMARAADQGETWALYRGATTNPLDQWEGEEVIFLDDLRAASMTAVEWLLLLDPYNASPATARYANKRAVAPRLIVITASIEPVEFFLYSRQRGGVNEAMDQFLRRLAAVVRVVRTEDASRYELAMVEGPGAPRVELVAGQRVRLTYSLGEPIPLDDGAASTAVAHLLDARATDLVLVPPVEPAGEAIYGE